MEATCVDYHLKVLRYGGISIRKESLQYKSFFVVAMALLLAYDLSVVGDVLNTDDFDVFLYSMYNFLGTSTALANSVILIINGRALYGVLIELKLLSYKLQSIPAYEEWLKKCILKAARQCKVLLVPTVLGSSLSIVGTMVLRIYDSDSSHWQLPFTKGLVFNPYNSPNFEVAWLFQSVGFALTQIIYLLPLLMIAAVCSYLTTMFKILCNQIENIVYMNAIEETDRKSKACFRKLRRIAINHQILIHIAQRLETLWSPLMFVYLFGFMLVLTCILAHVMMHPLADPRILKDAVLGITGILLIFILTYWGNEIMLESQLLKNACYQTEFFECSIPFQKSLAIMMSSSQRPVKFTAAKFADITLPTFLMILKLAFSFFSVFKGIMQGTN